MRSLHFKLARSLARAITTVPSAESLSTLSSGDLARRPPRRASSPPRVNSTLVIYPSEKSRRVVVVDVESRPPLPGPRFDSTPPRDPPSIPTPPPAITPRRAINPRHRQKNHIPNTPNKPYEPLVVFSFGGSRRLDAARLVDLHRRPVELRRRPAHAALVIHAVLRGLAAEELLDLVLAARALALHDLRVL